MKIRAGTVLPLSVSVTWTTLMKPEGRIVPG